MEWTDVGYQEVVSMVQAVVDAPVPARSRVLFERADAELVAAQFSPEPWEQFSHAHLAALRAGAAVLAARSAPPVAGRRAPCGSCST
ncbi:SAV_6107 family HEPN domain-containing protein [Cellulomonas soli]